MKPVRLPPETFDIPTAEIRRGYRAAIYFNRAKRVAADDPARDGNTVTMQVFQKNKGAVLCGIDEAIAVLKIGAGRWQSERDAEQLFDQRMTVKLKSRGAGRDQRWVAAQQMMRIDDELDALWKSEFDELDVWALRDGDDIDSWETVMHITGRYSSFAHLESVYLGVLARRSLVAGNVRRVCQAARGKPVLFFADRFDHWSTQGGDGYAASVGGATGFASDAMAAWWGERGVGTMPHALIAFFDGNTRLAVERFHAAFPDTALIALVDFTNDCVTEALKCADAFGDQLQAVRLDTSENMVDVSVIGAQMGDYRPTGVNPRLVHLVRTALDNAGHSHVQIIVSGGFNPEKIRFFEQENVPVDSYAVGSSLLRGNNDYTADIVLPTAKEGRWYRSNTRMERVT